MVSIVIPSYNNSLYLKEMIESIVKQSYKDWELIVVDDQSQDDTVQMLKEYEKKEKRIKSFIRENAPKGAQTCRNIGLENARGEYICFFDSDDLIADYCLEQRVKFMDENPDIDFAVFPAAVFKGEMCNVITFHGIFDYKHCLRAFIERNLPFVVWNNIYRIKSIKKNGLLWDTRLNCVQDSDFNIQALTKKMIYRFCLGKVDYFYRMFENEGSISKRMFVTKKVRSQLILIKKIIELTDGRYMMAYVMNILSIFRGCHSENNKRGILMILYTVINIGYFSNSVVFKLKLLYKLFDIPYWKILPYMLFPICCLKLRCNGIRKRVYVKKYREYMQSNCG